MGKVTYRAASRKPLRGLQIKASLPRMPTPARTPEPIASRDNAWLKRFRVALAGSSARRGGAEEIAAEGARLVSTVLQSGAEVIAVLVSKSGERHLPHLAGEIPPGARLLGTTDQLFTQIAGTETPQGVAALLRPPAATFDDLVGGPVTPLVVVLAGMQDPGNVGTLIRAAEAFGATGVATASTVGGGTANPFGPKALRASAGSALRLPVLRGIAVPVLLAQLRVAGVRAYAAHPADPSPDSPPNAAVKALAPWECDWRQPVALLIGNEGAGLPDEIVRSADAAVMIPQAAARRAQAPMDSLNAAVAGSVLLYEAARQRARL
jgi:TrmH family RNA methyltransferase